MNQPVRVAIIGMGGFAGSHHNVVMELEKEGLCRLVAACDPAWDAFSDRQKELDFAGRGVRCFDDYRALIETCRNQLDVITIPTPIHLHAPMHRDAVRAGLAVYLEKPPTLDFQELQAMEAVDSGARFKTNVAFNFIVDADRQALKARLMTGEFGRLLRVCYCGLSPRYTRYYERAPWAGRLKIKDSLVLDSPIGNAMAHYVHNVLYWAGLRDLQDWPELKTVSAECYRAHAIQGMDTVLIRGWTASDVEIRLAVSHASDTPRIQEWFECEKARVVYGVDGSLDIHWDDGRSETGGPHQRNLFQDNFRAFFDYIQGRRTRPVTTLKDSEPFVLLNDLAYISSGQIGTISPGQVIRTPLAEGGEKLAIVGLDKMADEFLGTGRLLGEQGVAWANRAIRPVGPDAVNGLKQVIDQMAGG
jgi:predicted dehydrogenase